MYKEHCTNIVYSWQVINALDNLIKMEISQQADYFVASNDDMIDRWSTSIVFCKYPTVPQFQKIVRSRKRVCLGACLGEMAKCDLRCLVIGAEYRRNKIVASFAMERA